MAINSRKDGVATSCNTTFIVFMLFEHWRVQEHSTLLQSVVSKGWEHP